MNELSSTVEQSLRQGFPEATSDECARFAAAWTNDQEKARTNLQAYLEWKRHHHVMNAKDIRVECLAAAQGENPNDGGCGAQLWTCAMKQALAFHHPNDPSKFVLDEPILMAPVRPKENGDHCHQVMTCRDGQRVIYILPGRLPLAAVHELDTYTTAMTLFLYYTLVARLVEPHRDDDDDDGDEGQLKDGVGGDDGSRAPTGATILLDCRAGRNWPNVMFHHEFAFIRHFLQVWQTFFPGLVHRVIVFPMPMVAKLAYQMIAPFLDADLRRRFVLVSGPSAHWQAPMPVANLDPLVASADLALLESLRVAAFL
jgi:CRAL/TRIO domain